MSEANVLLAEQFLEDRTQTDLGTFLSFLDDEAEIDFSELDRPYAHVYKGRDQIETLFREMTGPWREIRFITTNARSYGEDVVLDIERTAQSRESSFGVSSIVTGRLVVRNGKVAYWKLFNDRSDALAAAQLPE